MTNQNYLIHISLQPDSVNFLYFIHILFHLKNLWFEISKDYEIGLQKYIEYQIRVRD